MRAKDLRIPLAKHFGLTDEDMNAWYPSGLSLIHICDADYKFLKAQLKTDGYDEWYFIVWFMAATGARVSELLHICLLYTSRCV